MKFFNIDQHISVIADIKQIFNNLGHQVDDVCLSGHAWVMGREKQSVPMLDGDKWCGFLQRKAWDEFYDTYAHQLEQYDGFICTYPPIFSMLYKKFNKPIIIQVPIRYEYPCQSSKEDWELFNNFLQEGIDNKKIFIAANSLFDVKYTEAFINRSVEYIPSLCEYTNAKYSPEFLESIYYAATPYNEFKKVEDTLLLWKPAILKHGFKWEDLTKFRTIVHFPYNVSTMSFFEQYTMDIPLLVPNLNFLIELYSNPKYRILEQTSWNATFGRPTGSIIPTFKKLPDPNDYKNFDAMKYWMQFADFYNEEFFPYVLKFEGFGQLNFWLRNYDFSGISARMQNDQVRRKKLVYSKWEKLLSEVQNVIR